jgi:hypothetical protein
MKLSGSHYETTHLKIINDHMRLVNKKWPLLVVIYHDIKGLHTVSISTITPINYAY